MSTQEQWTGREHSMPPVSEQLGWGFIGVPGYHGHGSFIKLYKYPRVFFRPAGYYTAPPFPPGLLLCCWGGREGKLCRDSLPLLTVFLLSTLLPLKLRFHFLLGERHNSQPSGPRGLLDGRVEIIPASHRSFMSRRNPVHFMNEPARKSGERRR